MMLYLGDNGPEVLEEDDPRWPVCVCCGMRFTTWDPEPMGFYAGKLTEKKGPAHRTCAEVYTNMEVSAFIAEARAAVEPKPTEIPYQFWWASAGLMFVLVLLLST